MSRKASRREEIAAPLRPQHQPTPTTLTGNFRKHEKFVSRFLESPRDLLVYLPPGYEEETERRYPVFYMHDGQNLFDGATSFVPGEEWRVDETAEALIRQGAIEPIIIVAIYNTGEARLAEYTPTVSDEHGGGKADLYGRLLVEELKPFIDECYRSLTGSEHTGIGGSSLGGLVSLYLGLRYPGEFGKLAVMSPATWWDDRMIIRHVDTLAERPESRIWLDIGTSEGRDAHQDALRLRDSLVARGWKPGEDLFFVEEMGAPHSEAAWAQRVDPMLRFLFPERWDRR